MLGIKTKEEDTTPSRPATPSGASDTLSVISRQTKIDGDCVVDGRIRIEGHVAGNVCAGSLEVAESGSVDGDITAGVDAQGPFLIAGRVRGSVRSPRVEVASGGVVLEGVEGDEVQIQGRVQGGVVARKRLLLESTAQVEGDVRARALALDEGGQVNGTIVMGEAAADLTAAEDPLPGAESETDSALHMPDRRNDGTAQDDGTAQEEVAGEGEKSVDRVVVDAEVDTKTESAA